MPQMTTGQARVIDPILSGIALAYRNPDIQRVGRILFPRVVIPQRGAQVLKFGKESFRLYNTRRAPGGNTGRIQYGYAADPVALTQESLEGLVPIELMEEAAAVPGLDLAKGAVELVQDIFDRAEEYEQAQIATDATRYDSNHKLTLAGTSKWSDPASDPAKDVKRAREAVRSSTGRYPNKLILSPDVFNALTEHPKIKDQFKYTSADSVTTLMLAKYFDIASVAVGNDIYLPKDSADNADFVDMWRNVAVLAYVPTSSNFMVPSYGYTYHLRGHPMVEKPYYENAQKSWVYPIMYERQIVHTATAAGFLFTTPV